MSDLAATNCGCGCEDNCGGLGNNKRRYGLQLHYLDSSPVKLLRK